MLFICCLSKIRTVPWLSLIAHPWIRSAHTLVPAIVWEDRPIANVHQVQYGPYTTDFDFCVNRFTGEVGMFYWDYFITFIGMMYPFVFEKSRSQIYKISYLS